MAAKVDKSWGTALWGEALRGAGGGAQGTVVTMTGPCTVSCHTPKKPQTQVAGEVQAGNVETTSFLGIWCRSGCTCLASGGITIPGVVQHLAGHSWLA